MGAPKSHLSTVRELCNLCRRMRFRFRFCSSGVSSSVDQANYRSDTSTYNTKPASKLSSKLTSNLNLKLNSALLHRSGSESESKQHEHQSRSRQSQAYPYPHADLDSESASTSESKPDPQAAQPNPQLKMHKPKPKQKKQKHKEQKQKPQIYRPSDPVTYLPRVPVGFASGYEMRTVSPAPTRTGRAKDMNDMNDNVEMEMETVLRTAQRPDFYPGAPRRWRFECLSDE